MAIIQRPKAVGLLLCRMVMIEEKTHNVRLGTSFARLDVDAVPSPPAAFYVYTVRRDGLGEVKLNMVVSRCDTLDEVYTKGFRVQFKDPLRQLRLHWLVKSCSFPAPGRYEFALYGDGELITQSVLQVA